MAKHVHYDVICAWAAGQTVQLYSDMNSDWIDCERTTPSFSPNRKYRVKPWAPPEPKHKVGDVLRAVHAQGCIHWFKGGEVVRVTNAPYWNDDYGQWMYVCRGEELSQSCREVELTAYFR